MSRWRYPDRICGLLALAATPESDAVGGIRSTGPGHVDLDLVALSTDQKNGVA